MFINFWSYTAAAALLDCITFAQCNPNYPPGNKSTSVDNWMMMAVWRAKEVVWTVMRVSDFELDGLLLKREEEASLWQ